MLESSPHFHRISEPYPAEILEASDIIHLGTCPAPSFPCIEHARRLCQEDRSTIQLDAAEELAVEMHELCERLHAAVVDAGYKGVTEDTLIRYDSGTDEFIAIPPL